MGKAMEIVNKFNFRRILYLALGGITTYEAVASELWLLLIPAAYILSMGIFGWGCASGKCDIR